MFVVVTSALFFLKNGTSQNFTIVNFGHPVCKSWLWHLTSLRDVEGVEMEEETQGSFMHYCYWSNSRHSKLLSGEKRFLPHPQACPSCQTLKLFRTTSDKYSKFDVKVCNKLISYWLYDRFLESVDKRRHS